ncbi:peptide ABC transporter substrate-binding protein, partial [Bacillus cereus]|nr:peptide ABC transporter substrate-binding protein [Bacillus cereus]
MSEANDVLGEHQPLVEVHQLKKHFVTAKDLLGRSSEVLKAVDGVSFQIKRGET